MNPSRKTQRWLVIVPLLVLMLFAVTSFGRNIILQQFDAIRLASFSRRIATADRAVATALGGSTQITFTGADLEKIVRGVSSGTSSRMPDAVYMSSAFATVTFHRGTNTLGQINMSEQLFAFPESAQFFDRSTLLNQTIYTPLRQKLHESHAAEGM